MSPPGEMTRPPSPAKKTVEHGAAGLVLIWVAVITSVALFVLLLVS